MRLGVSGKIFLAYAALVATFVASSASTLVYLERAREQLLVGELFMRIQTHVDPVFQKVRDFPLTKSAARRPSVDAMLSLRLLEARNELGSSVRAIERAKPELRPGSPLGPELEHFRVRLVELDEQLGTLADGLGAFLAGDDDEVRKPFESGMAALTSRLERLKRDTAAESREIASRLASAEARARGFTLLLGGVGLAVAVGAALFLYFTLRPLKILRARARAIAGGDYASRVGVHSRDEIGDLAREFDAMARAIEEREQRLIRSERLATVGRMAAHVTHEIRNPLASIGLYAELLGDEVPENAEARRLAQSIANEVDRLSEITDTYLRFVRLPKPRREPEDLGQVVRSAVEFARAELELAGIVVELSIAEPLPEVSVDEAQIRQALLNLLRNAKEAMAGGGRLAVTLSPRDAVVELSIADTGPGIAPEHVGKIFDPFFSTKEKGTGLGLALVQQIVADHAGQIDVRTPAGGGTTFVITFPTGATSDARVTEPGTPPEAAAEGRRTEARPEARGAAPRSAPLVP